MNSQSFIFFRGFSGFHGNHCWDKFQLQGSKSIRLHLSAWFLADFWTDLFVPKLGKFDDASPTFAPEKRDLSSGMSKKVHMNSKKLWMISP